MLYAERADERRPVPNSGNFSLDEIIDVCKEAYVVYKEEKVTIEYHGTVVDYAHICIQ